MSTPQQYIAALLDRIPKWDLPLIEHRNTFDSIKDRLTNSDDITADLKGLFTVHDYGDFALSLLWIVEKVERNPTLTESTDEEQILVFSKFKKAVGEAGWATTSDSAFIETPAEESTAEQSFTMEQPAAMPYGTFAPAGEGSGGDPSQFGYIFDKLTEAVQIGDDSRMEFIGKILQECATVLGGEFPADYKQLAELLQEFLQYVTTNQFLDDIRVMNLVQNVQDPISQWANADPAAREGILDQAIQVLQDYKQMFE